jgi:transcriptional regulator with GAF, ATPase, and Fis domain
MVKGLIPCHDDRPDELVRGFAPMNLIGRSQPFVEMLRAICLFAPCDVPVLVVGETGTGKELVSRALHYVSPRRDRSFIPVNCGALPDQLFESELFGHERGAFTDAHAAHKGLIAQAEGGTLLLDEVDTLSAKAQVALLRFLQDFKYRPVGSGRLANANVRLIAATNADLPGLVQAGRFRQDLFFRLDVVSIALPPLRMRDQDIVLLARHFLQHFATMYGRCAPRLDPTFLDHLSQQAWPGNVRELENTIQRAIFLAEDGVMRCAPTASWHNPAAALCTGEFDCGLRIARDRLMQAFERRYLTWAMQEAHGNVAAAARRALTDRRQFDRMLRRYAIDKASFRPDAS